MQKKVPLRKCVACQEMKIKRELLRIVRTPHGEVLIDLTGKLAGRGAYLCKQAVCFAGAKKKKALDRSLDTVIPADIYDRLANDFQGMNADG